MQIKEKKIEKNIKKIWNNGKKRSTFAPANRKERHLEIAKQHGYEPKND